MLFCVNGYFRNIFMKPLLSLVLLASAVFAQAPDYPTFFVGFGGSYNRYSTGTPFASGWTTAAVHLGSGIYSISTMDQTASAASLRTGMAKVVAQNNGLTLMVHADAGITTGTPSGAASSSVALGSFSGGAILMYDLGGLLKAFKGKGLYALGLVRIQGVNSAAVQPIYEFGFGRAFK
jgi:hypothetical protein